MRKLILFNAERGEIQKYRESTQTKIGESFYRVANAGSVSSLTKRIAEYYDCSGRPVPPIGYRLTETVPEDRDSFRDNGWEVIRVCEYPATDPESEFDSICICYCAYKPLNPEDEWTKKAHRLPVSIDSFGGDKAAFDRWQESQKQPTNA